MMINPQRFTFDELQRDELIRAIDARLPTLHKKLARNAARADQHRHTTRMVGSQLENSIARLSDLRDALEGDAP